jgi:hypothetical protein
MVRNQEEEFHTRGALGVPGLGGALRRFFKAVLFCPVCDTYTTQVPLRENKYFCQTCHRVTNQEVSLGFSQEAGWER